MAFEYLFLWILDIIVLHLTKNSFPESQINFLGTLKLDVGYPAVN